MTRSRQQGLLCLLLLSVALMAEPSSDKCDVDQVGQAWRGAEYDIIMKGGHVGAGCVCNASLEERGWISFQISGLLANIMFGYASLLGISVCKFTHISFHAVLQASMRGIFYCRNYCM